MKSLELVSILTHPIPSSFDHVTVVESLDFFLSVANTEKVCIRMPLKFSLLPKLIKMVTSLLCWKFHPRHLKLKVCRAWEYPKVLHDKDPSTRDKNGQHHCYNINKVQQENKGSPYQQAT